MQELCFAQGCIIVNRVSSDSYNPDIPGIPSILLETLAEEDPAAMRINLSRKVCDCIDSAETEKKNLP